MSDYRYNTYDISGNLRLAKFNVEPEAPKKNEHRGRPRKIGYWIKPRVNPEVSEEIHRLNTAVGTRIAKDTQAKAVRNHTIVMLNTRGISTRETVRVFNKAGIPISKSTISHTLYGYGQYARRLGKYMQRGLANLQKMVTTAVKWIRYRLGTGNNLPDNITELIEQGIKPP